MNFTSLRLMNIFFIKISFVNELQKGSSVFKHLKDPPPLLAIENL